MIISKDLKVKELILNNCFKPLIKTIINEGSKVSCDFLKNQLSFLNIVSCGKLRDNSSYICFKNLICMYSNSNEIPMNMFWISCINVNSNDIIIPPNIFLEDINNLSKNILKNGFDLTHEWYIENEGNSAVFLYFDKVYNNVNYFITIFIAFKNIEGFPTLNEVKNKII
jgi:hypothetical protein